MTINVAIVVAVLMFASAIPTSVSYQTSRLPRASGARALGCLLVVIAASFVIELQPLVLRGMFEADR